MAKPKTRRVTVGDAMGNIKDPDHRALLGCACCGEPFELDEDAGKLLCPCGEKPASFAGVFKVLRGRCA